MNEIIDNSLLDKIRNDNMFYRVAVREFYEKMDLGQDEKHFDEVYNTACSLAWYDYLNRIISLDEVRIVMAAAAYHDIGKSISYSKHELKSADMINDGYSITSYINKEFSSHDLVVIKSIIRDHPSSIKDADNELSAILKDANNVYRIHYYRFLYRVVSFNYKEANRIAILSTSNNSHWVMAMVNEIRSKLNDYCEYYEEDPNRNLGLNNSYAGSKLYPGKGRLEFTLPDDELLKDVVGKVHIDYDYKLANKGFYNPKN